MEKTTYNFIEDAGHGWLAVPYKHLQGLRIVDDISQYSYRDGVMCYLEEDCDAGVFLDAYRRGMKEEPSVRFVNGGDRAALRDFPHYYKDKEK